MKSDDRAKRLDRVIRGLWASLESHLEYTHATVTRQGTYGRDRAFHRRCCREYAAMINDLTQLL